MFNFVRVFTKSTYPTFDSRYRKKKLPMAASTRELYQLTELSQSLLDTFTSIIQYLRTSQINYHT